MTTVAISGHRPGRKYSGRNAACADLDRILADLSPPLTLISALAEGADRDAAEAALAAGSALEALTPFDHDAYRDDFSDAESVAHFESLLARATARETRDARIEPGGASGPLRDAAYAAAGLAMLDRADLLIAVWDGRQGGYGGASTIVAAARARGMPVVWIDSHGRRPPRLLRDASPRPAAYSPGRLRRALRRRARGAGQSVSHSGSASAGSK